MSTLRSLSPWSPAIKLWQQHWRENVLLALLGIVLPLLIFDLQQSWSAQQQIPLLKELGGQQPPPSFDAFLLKGLDFLGQYLISWLLFMLLIAASFLGLIAQIRHRYLTQRPLGLKAALIIGLKTLLGRGLLTLILAGITLFIGSQLLFSLLGPSFIAQILLIVVFGLLLAIPPLLIATKDRPWRLFTQALTIGYAPPIKGMKWTIFFQVVSWELIFIATITLTGFLRESLIYLDMWLPLPRSVWLATFDGVDFGPAYLLASLVSILFLSFMVSALATIMTVYIANIQRLNGFNTKA
jgi:hypothetical protein